MDLSTLERLPMWIAGRAHAPTTTRYGEVTVKLAHRQGRPLRGKPEYEDCKRLALERRVPIHAVYAAVREALSSHELGPEPARPSS